MKITELMFGDWVNWWHSRKQCYVPIKIVVEYFSSDFCEDELKPILITSEILEKNELKCSNGFIGTLYWINEQCYLKKQHSDYFEFNYHDGHDKVVIDLKYVHQLQHALKLCGIEKEIKL